MRPSSIARDLRTSKYRMRVTRDKTKYDRKRERDGRVSDFHSPEQVRKMARGGGKKGDVE